jgi:phenylacetate-CoA ligase
MRVEARPGAASHDERARSEARLGALGKQAAGVTVAVEVVEPGAIERSTGKAVRVVDRRVRAAPDGDGW